MEAAPFDLVRDALTTALVVATPVLLVALAVGVIMALVQTATQVQDHAVGTVPKLIICGAALVLLAGWMAERVLSFAVAMWGGTA